MGADTVGAGLVWRGIPSLPYTPRVYAAMDQGMLHMHVLHDMSHDYSGGNCLQVVQIRLVAERLSLRQLHVIVPVFSSRVCISMYTYISIIL